VDTLTGGTYFQALLSGRWKAQDDGSFFIDADPRLFEHILSYLRRYTLPLFYDRRKGHDHGLYMALLGEAKYFGVEGLVRYLREKEYLQVVKVQHSAEELNRLEDVKLIVGMDMEVEYHAAWIKKKVYVCPRGIFVHRGQPERCGRQCENARGEVANVFEDEMVMKLVRVKRQVIVDERVIERVGN
jgi:BTB/POZ domain-containing protein KCTD9